MSFVNDDTQCERCGYRRASHRREDGELHCPPGVFIPKPRLIPESHIREYLPGEHAQLDVAESLQILLHTFQQVQACHQILSCSSVKFASADIEPGADGTSISARVRGFAIRAEQLQGLVEEYEQAKHDPHRALRVLQAWLGPKGEAR